MKHIWVRYKKGNEGIVNQRALDDLLALHAIERFYRTSEARRVIVWVDKMREVNRGYRNGPARRRFNCDKG